ATRIDTAGFFAADAWVYVTGTYNGATMSLYRNGILVKSVAVPDALAAVTRTTNYIARSNWAADGYFNGMIDELQVSRIGRSADWIKLSYENQKAAQTLISFAEIDDENYSLWPYVQKVYLNTSSTGANVSGTVRDFPVLIRLNPVSFGFFPQTLPGGADVRFASSSGNHLSYEIERWVDGTNNNDTAEIWVRVDTIIGNNSQQFILMHWGRSGAVSRSNGSAVFDVDNGFQGVWHLNESPVGTSSVKDRTRNNNHGSPQNNLNSDDLVNGTIGKAMNFDGPNGSGGDHIRLPNSPTMDNTGNLTVSCWFRMANGATSDYYGIAGKYTDFSSSFLGYMIGRASSQRIRFVTGNGQPGAGPYVESNATLTDNLWHHATGVVNAGVMSLFIDGVRQSGTAAGTAVASNDYGYIGRRASNLDHSFFVGDIDEVRFNRTARSADWIKLGYENQKAAQTLISFSITDNEDYATWPFSQKLYLNTTTAGADVAGTVTGFPLLVRLNPLTFKGFAATLPGGADIRFSSGSGAHLPFEIERWIDGSGNNDTAEIWVRVDTVRGGNATQHVRIHWGKSGVTSRSNSREVFDIAGGFVAAYHLNQAGGSAADATANNLNAEPRGTLPDRSDGLVGFGGSFNGGPAYYTAGNDPRFAMSTNNAFTLSAWVNRLGNNSCRTRWEGIAGKYRWAAINGREYTLGCDTTAGAGLGMIVSSDGSPATETYALSRIVPVNGTWYNVTGMYDGSRMRMYINGVPSGSPATMRTIYSSLNADFRIGIIDSASAANYQAFNGRIDEVVLSKVARNDDWIKLSYETQKPFGSCSVIPDHLAPPMVIDGTPADQTVREGTTIGMTVRASGCGPFIYRWYKNRLTAVDTVPGQRDSTLQFPSVHPADAAAYICIVSNVYGSDTSRAAVLVVEADQQIVNPVILRGTFVDSTHVALSLSRFSNLPPAATATFPWYADSVWVWYRANDFPARPLRGSNDLVKFPLSLLQRDATDRFDTVLTVPRYPSTACYHYCFIASVYWKNGAGSPDSIAPFADPLTSGASVYMCDTSALPNPLRFLFDYRQQTDSVVVTLSNITQLAWDLVSAVEVRYVVGSGTAVADRMPISGFERSVDIFSKSYRDPRFNGEEKWVYWEVLPIGKYGNPSEPVRDSCKVGVPRPDNPLILSVGSIASSRIGLFWQRSGVTFDSIRIWYGFQEVPMGVDISPAIYGSLLLPGNDTAVVVTGLSASTTYYFGLQAQKAGVWSSVTAASRTSAVTGEIEDTVSMANRLRLLSLVFDTAANSVVMEWVVDTSGLSLEAGIVWSRDSIGYPEPNPPGEGRVTAIVEPGTPMRYSIAVPATNLAFNNEYFFALWLRKVNGRWIQPTAASVKKLAIPPASWETVVFFRNADTVRALSNLLILRKIEEMTVESKLRIVKLPVATSGCIPMSIAMTFEHQNAPPLPLFVGLSYVAMPQGYSAADLRMYHYVDSSGLWVRDTLPWSIDTVGRVYSVRIRASDCVAHPFIVMIDTVRPVISLVNDSDGAVPAGAPLNLVVLSRDNIANAHLTLLGGRGDDRLSFSRAIYSARPVDTTRWSVPGTLVSGEAGVRLHLSISDGRFDSTINVSRDVARIASDSVLTAWLQWQPLGPSAILDDHAIGAVLRDHADNNQILRYDSKLLRLFRWSTNRWEEYTEAKREQFNLEPTRVVWLKRRLVAPIRYGKGRTASLRTPYRFRVPAHGWIDFCLPYRFSIRVGDILAASGNGAAQSPFLFYEWKRGEDDSLNRYYADAVYLPLTEGKNDPTRELNSMNGTAYTVYNSTDTVREVVIPGIPVALSRVTAKRAAQRGWNIVVRANSSEGTVNPLYCGFLEGGKNRIVYPRSPSWSDVRLGVFDEKTRSLGGGMLVRELPDGGHCYEIVFENTARKRERIAWHIEHRFTRGDEITVAVIDPETGALSAVHDSMTVDVDPGSSVYRWLVAGSADYFSRLARLPFRGEFRIVRALPNPFRKNLRIRYHIPYGGIEWIRCEVYDPRGRVLWKLQDGPRLHPGDQEVVWTPRSEKAMAAGTYIVQLTGFDGRNRKTGERITRVTYLP
ncbi:MAG: DUF2341 domain-containing protein, partial [Chitinispirillaceae bacterium]|nr:DUF2341 domain-containing protein [Chitinispirillaceae bacterium]